ncbi:MAG: hypothetical protein U9Q62_10420 [Campylobacterota bacterium]|nr:hypothetical protein [Campylobacterota bacterium]
MELKDVILSTLAEMDETVVEHEAVSSQPSPPEEKHQEPAVIEDVKPSVISESNLMGEAKHLESVKERLLVLFEGFQSPNNKEIEAKVDLTLNFLEYLLSSIDTRLDTLKKRG